MATPTQVEPVAAPEAAAPEPTRLEQAHELVKKNMCWSMGISLVPVPLIDMAAVIAFQIRMLKQLSDLYGIPFKEHAAKNIVAALVGGLSTGVLGVAILSSLVKSVPGIGMVLGGLVVMPVIAGAITYAVGKVFIQHFESGGTFLNFNPEKTRRYFEEQFKEGQKLASDARAKGKA